MLFRSEANLRASIPNPEGVLMPGLYVRAKLAQTQMDNAILLPQQAVTRGQTDIVMVINPDNSFAPRPVTISHSQDNQWVVTGGLKAGEKVIVDGLQMVMLMGAKQVTPVPWDAKQKDGKGAQMKKQMGSQDMDGPKTDKASEDSMKPQSAPADEPAQQPTK